MIRMIVFLAAACIAVSLAGEVEDLGATAPTGTAVKTKPPLGEATKAKARAGTGGLFGGALLTSGTFTMMASTGFVEEERRERDELGEANDWDLTNGGKCG